LQCLWTSSERLHASLSTAMIWVKLNIHRKYILISVKHINNYSKVLEHTCARVHTGKICISRWAHSREQWVDFPDFFQLYSYLQNSQHCLRPYRRRRQWKRRALLNLALRGSHGYKVLAASLFSALAHEGSFWSSWLRGTSGAKISKQISALAGIIKRWSFVLCWGFTVV